MCFCISIVFKRTITLLILFLRLKVLKNIHLKPHFCVFFVNIYDLKICALNPNFTCFQLVYKVSCKTALGPRHPSGCYVHSDPQQPTVPPARYFLLIKYQENLWIAKVYVSEVVSKGIFCLAVFIWSNYTLSRESSIFLYSLKQKQIFFFIFLKKKINKIDWGKTQPVQPIMVGRLANLGQEGIKLHISQHAHNKFKMYQRYYYYLH